MPVRNQLATLRQQRGISAADLAQRTGVSRQTIYAIEAGQYSPNTEVTLRLARELETSVEDIFSLDDPAPNAPAPVPTQVLAAAPLAAHQSVRVARVADRWISVPVSAAPYFLPEADGLLDSPRKVTLFSPSDSLDRRLIVAGCDPATALLCRLTERAAQVEILPAAAPSQLALQWLHQGKVHIAGSHLEDPHTGEFNLPYLRRHFPAEDLAVLTFAEWEEGFVIRPGNPKRICAAEHLARRDVRFINRESGSGSRSLLDRLLAQAGLDGKSVRGYDTIARGHLAAAYAVLTGEADCCLATAAAAQTFSLDFVPLKRERYDLVLRRDTLASVPAAHVLADLLQRAALRRRLQSLAGYDVTHTGAARA